MPQFVCVCVLEEGGDPFFNAKVNKFTLFFFFFKWKVKNEVTYAFIHNTPIDKVSKLIVI